MRSAQSALVIALIIGLMALFIDQDFGSISMRTTPIVTAAKSHILHATTHSVTEFITQYIPIKRASAQSMTRTTTVSKQPSIRSKDKTVEPLQEPNTTNPTRQGDIVLIQFEPTLSSEEREEMIARIDGELIDWLAPIHTAKVRIPTAMGRSANPTQAVAKIRSVVEWVERDGLVRGVGVPNDPDVTDDTKVYAPQLLNLFDAWDYTTGDLDVVISILDTGINPEHPEFEGRLLEGHNFISGEGPPTDDHGHGTHVAGIAAAAINNERGSSGVCGNCGILPIKVLDENNVGTWSGVSAGLIYAVGNGADIIVLSLGGNVGSQTMEAAIEYATEQGVLVIAAAGNAASDADFYPAAYPEVLGVGATQQKDVKWPLSNFGNFISVVAPGNAIYGTYYDLDNAYGGYTFLSGTSMAAPHVAGLAGLLLSQDPTRSMEDITRLITTTVVDLGDPGWDPLFGHGRIDPVAALAAEAPSYDLSGIVQLDNNGDGTLSDDEMDTLANMRIEVQNMQGEVIYETTTDAQGQWAIGNILEGTYIVAGQPESGYRMLENSEYEVTLGPTQPSIELDLIVAPAPTATSIGIIDVNREGRAITLNWRVDDPLVTSIIIERGLTQDGEFMPVGEYTVEQELAAQSLNGQSAINTTAEIIVDEIPTELQHRKIFYRFVIMPGQATHGPIVVDPDIYLSFIPMVSK